MYNIFPYNHEYILAFPSSLIEINFLFQLKIPRRNQLAQTLIRVACVNAAARAASNSF